MTRSFKVVVTVTKKPYDRPIHFKVDGSRFDSEKTVKFNVNSKYIVDLSFQPPQTLESLIVQGVKLDVEEFQKSEDAVAYRAEWLTSGFDKSTKGTRLKLIMEMQIKNAGELRTELQAKFYGEHEAQHVCWGSALTFLEYECKTSENGAFVDKIKETYR